VRGRLGLLVGFGAGYVLGAKAGKERYEQLNRLYENLTKTSAYKKARHNVKDAVGTGFETAKDAAAGGVSKAKDKVSGSSSRPGDLKVAPPPNT
jgi:hypothetical protein